MGKDEETGIRPGGIGDPPAGDDGTGDAELRRPTGRYGNLILFVERFPLRLFVVIIGLSICLKYYSHIRDLTYVIPGAPFGATLLYLLMAAALFGEMLTGWLTRHIKDLIIRRIMRAEEDAEVL